MRRETPRCVDLSACEERRGNNVLSRATPARGKRRFARSIVSRARYVNAAARISSARNYARDPARTVALARCDVASHLCPPARDFGELTLRDRRT